VPHARRCRQGARDEGALRSTAGAAGRRRGPAGSGRGLPQQAPQGGRVARLHWSSAARQARLRQALPRISTALSSDTSMAARTTGSSRYE